MSEDPLEPSDPALSAHQLEAISRAREILDEHFGCYLLVVHVESEDGKREQAHVTWNGGALMARALAYEGIDHITKGAPKAKPQEE